MQANPERIAVCEGACGDQTLYMTGTMQQQKNTRDSDSQALE
jgi:hypothetical protein